MPSAKLLFNTIALDPNRWTSHKRPYVRLVDVLPDLARAGFYDLEVWQYHLSRLEREEVRALKQRAADLGVSMPIVGLYPVLHATGEERARERKHVGALLGAAAFLGAWGGRCSPGGSARRT